jgi:hypothetical protein
MENGYGKLRSKRKSGLLPISLTALSVFRFSFSTISIASGDFHGGD